MNEFVDMPDILEKISKAMRSKSHSGWCDRVEFTMQEVANLLSNIRDKQEYFITLRNVLKYMAFKGFIDSYSFNLLETTPYPYEKFIAYDVEITVPGRYSIKERKHLESVNLNFTVVSNILKEVVVWFNGGSG